MSHIVISLSVFSILMFSFFKKISNYVLEKLRLNKQHNEESSVHKKDRQEKNWTKKKLKIWIVNKSLSYAK